MRNHSVLYCRFIGKFAQSVSLCKNVFTQCKQIYTKRKRNIKNKHLALWLTDIVHLIVRWETTRCRDKRIEYLLRIIMLICLFIIGFPKSKYDKSTWGFTCGILKHFFRSIQYIQRKRERERMYHKCPHAKHMPILSNIYA